ncbi:MAG: hypothetical protein WDO71_22915 [Bacteroidota bacterium]
MNKNYRQLTENVRARLNPDNIAIQKSFADELATLTYSDVLVYIRTAMNSPEPEYTQKSKDAGERVKEHLSKELKDVVFKYQGSVMTDTHIKGYSDIDLLTICDKFYTYDRYNIQQILNTPEKKSKYYSTSITKMETENNNPSYSGDSLLDLRNIRNDSERILKNVYTVCDTNNAKAIKIRNLSLNRDVDIVIANWYDDVSSIINDKGDYRGIQVYNKGTHSKENSDFPFLSIKRINERSAESNGRLKKMIRFIKHTKANSDQEIKLSSFDINAVCYDIELPKYQYLSFYDLVPIIYFQIKNICSDQTKADNIISVDGREYIFRGDSEKLNNLKRVLVEIESVYLDLKSNLVK